jgi:hypothetical protein
MSLYQVLKNLWQDDKCFLKFAKFWLDKVCILNVSISGLENRMQDEESFLTSKTKKDLLKELILPDTTKNGKCEGRVSTEECFLALFPFF